MKMEDLDMKSRRRFHFLRHVPNNVKTDEQWKEYLKYYEMMGWETPDRNEPNRPLSYGRPKRKRTKFHSKI